jgi:pimeloyl-ACP methyl ester carboxylesterase
LRQAVHRPRALLWRGVISALATGMMATGLYPLAPHALRFAQRRTVRPPPWGATLREWAVAATLGAARPLGFLGLPGRGGRGPRPIILVHGYAMSRACFLPLAVRLRRAGLGPVLGFEYWSLGKTASAARRLGEYVEEVRRATGAAQVDLVGHSMGGVVARYFVQLAGGDGVVANLITVGSPHAGTDVSAIGLGRPTRELLLGSSLLARLRVAPPPRSTKITVIWSRADALVPDARRAHLDVDGAEEVVYDDLGHVSLLASRRVAGEIIQRLRTASPS